MGSTPIRFHLTLLSAPLLARHHGGKGPGVFSPCQRCLTQAADSTEPRFSEKALPPTPSRASSWASTMPRGYSPISMMTPAAWNRDSRTTLPPPEFRSPAKSPCLAQSKRKTLREVWRVDERTGREINQPINRMVQHLDYVKFCPVSARSGHKNFALL